MVSTIEEEHRLAVENKQMGVAAVFQGRNKLRFLIASWPKVMQQLVGLTVFNTYATYFCEPSSRRLGRFHCEKRLTRFGCSVQLAGNKDPFTVTVILACVQLLSVLLSASTTDRYGRRWQTIIGYAVTVLSVLSLGIVGCFDYTSKALGSLLIFFACLATFSTTGASAIGYAYAAEIPQQRLRAKTAGWALAFSNLFGILFSFTVPLMLGATGANWNAKTGFLWVFLVQEF